LRRRGYRKGEEEEGGKLRRRGYRKGEEEEEEEGVEVQEKGRPGRRGVDRGREGGS